MCMISYKKKYPDISSAVDHLPLPLAGDVSRVSVQEAVVASD
jgi:hypothetical protein